MAKHLEKTNSSGHKFDYHIPIVGTLDNHAKSSSVSIVSYKSKIDRDSGKSFTRGMMDGFSITPEDWVNYQDGFDAFFETVIYPLWEEKQAEQLLGSANLKA